MSHFTFFLSGARHRTAHRIQSKVLEVIIPQVQRSHFRGPTVQPPHIRARRFAWGLAWSPGANLNAITAAPGIRQCSSEAALLLKLLTSHIPPSILSRAFTHPFLDNLLPPLEPKYSTVQQHCNKRHPKIAYCN